LKTEGYSKRKLSERKDPGAHSVGCYIEQGFPADAIQYYLRGLTNGRPAETPLDEALASASIPQFRWPGHPHASRGRSGPIQGRPGVGRGQSMHSGVPEGGPGTRSNSLHHRRDRYRFQASFRQARILAFWRLGFRQCGFRHIARIPPARRPIRLGAAAGFLACYCPRSPFGSRVSHQIQRHLLQSMPAARAI